MDENKRTIIIDVLNPPVVSNNFWVLDLNLMDFTLAPLITFEQCTTPLLKLQINGFQFALPGTWNVLIYDEETSILDVVPVFDLAGKRHTSFIYGPDMLNVTGGAITVVDYISSGDSFYPNLNKNQMLCHPIAADRWIVAAPSDSYNKYLKDKVIGDIV